jgi:hypothetical protein
MQAIKKGDMVRKRGKRQLMEVTGPAGLGAVTTPAGIVSAPMTGRVMCAWMSKGRTITLSFEVADLELVA